MKVWKLKELDDRHEICLPFLNTDQNGRKINIYKFGNVSLVGENLCFPNVLLYNSITKDVYDPSEERVMSLYGSEPQKVPDIIAKDQLRSQAGKYFYFIYNTDNYYHFLYDSIPYLLTYLHLKERDPDIKLLMSFPNTSKQNNYPFVEESLDLLGIEKNDIVLADNSVV